MPPSADRLHVAKTMSLCLQRRHPTRDAASFLLKGQGILCECGIPVTDLPWVQQTGAAAALEPRECPSLRLHVAWA